MRRNPHRTDVTLKDMKPNQGDDMLPTTMALNLLGEAGKIELSPSETLEVLVRRGNLKPGVPKGPGKSYRRSDLIAWVEEYYSRLEHHKKRVLHRLRTGRARS